MKVMSHRIGTDLVQPWVRGYHRNTNVFEFYKHVDVVAKAQRGLGGGAP